MRFSDSWWSSLLYIFDFASLSTFNEKQTEQHALLSNIPVTDVVSGPAVPPQVTHKEDSVSHVGSSDQPIFFPPYADDHNSKNRIQCDYTKMWPEWKPCNDENRQCWLKGPNGQKYNITTDYELKTPQGITRNYTLDITEKALAPDGIPMRYGKVFNNAYPGPWSMSSLEFISDLQLPLYHSTFSRSLRQSPLHEAMLTLLFTSSPSMLGRPIGNYRS